MGDWFWPLAVFALYVARVELELWLLRRQVDGLWKLCGILVSHATLLSMRDSQPDVPVEDKETKEQNAGK